MRLVYIYHSGFVVEAEGFSILIDYFKDTNPGPAKGFVRGELLKRPGTLYVLASHFHPDHFTGIRASFASSSFLIIRRISLCFVASVAFFLNAFASSTTAWNSARMLLCSLLPAGCLHLLLLCQMPSSPDRKIPVSVPDCPDNPEYRCLPRIYTSSVVTSDGVVKRISKGVHSVAPGFTAAASLLSVSVVSV